MFIKGRQIYFIHLILTLISISALFGQEEKPYPKIGIALSGGGVRGLAHIGILRRLEEEGIKIYMISGSSMGAMIGGLYAIGYDTYEIETNFRNSETKDILSNKPERDNTENYLKKTSDRTVIELEFTPNGLQLPNALNNGHKMLKKLRQAVYESEYYNTDFDNLKYKLRIVCSDIQNAKKAVFSEGDLPVIILGSVSFPGLFKPVIYKDMKLLDGGLTDNIPTDILEDCDIILASDTTHDTPSKYEDYNFIELLDRISVTMTSANVESNLAKADIVFSPFIEDVGIVEISDPDSLIKLGYEEAGKYIDSIRQLIGTTRNPEKQDKQVSPSNLRIEGNTIYTDEEILTEIVGFKDNEMIRRKILKKYRNNGYIMSSVEINTENDTTMNISEGIINSIKITGDTTTRKSFIREELTISKGKVLKYQDIESSIDNLYGSGLFHKINFEIDIPTGSVTFIVEEKPYDVIRIGAHYQTDRGFLGLIELANKNMHGKRAELYGNLTYGEKLNRFEISYYNIFMKRSSLFFEVLPYYQVKEKDIYISHNLQEGLTYSEKRAGGNLNFGFQLFDNYQGMFSIIQENIDYEDNNYDRTSGIFRILADSRNDHIIPTKGFYFSWNMETGMFDFDDNKKFQKIWWQLSLYKQLSRSYNAELGICGGTGDKLVPYSERFLVGGVRLMPGTFFEEYSTLQYFRFKLKQNILIGSGTLFDAYFSFAYFLNGFWDEPDIEWNYRDFSNSFYFGLILNSNFGPVEAGWGLTAGNTFIETNNRFFVSLGYPLQ